MTRSHASYWWLIAFCFLAAIYTTGVLKSNALPRILGAYPTAVVNRAPNFDYASEALIENRIEMRFVGLESSKFRFLFTVRKGETYDPRIFDILHPERYDPDWRPGLDDLQAGSPYRSQIGLQGRLYAAASDAMGLDRPRTYIALRGFSTLMLAAMLATLITWLASVWGRMAGVAALVFSTFATGFNLFAPQLYWVTFAHVAPTVLTACLAAPFMKSSLPAHLAVFFSAFALFVVKFSSGYEFTTVTIAAAAIPFFVAFAGGRISAKSLTAYTAAIVGTGIAAFGVSLGLYDMLFREAFGESGLAFLQTRARSTLGLSAVDPLDIPLQMAKVAVINSADIGGYGIPNLVVLSAGLPFVWIAARALVLREFADEKARIALAVTAALLASTSWLLLQFPHVLFHPRYSTLLVAFPFGLVLAAALGRLWHLRRQKSVAQ